MSWKDIDITLDKNINGDIKDDKEIDAIINSITNIFKTFQGSRRMIPSFALPIYNLLFEQIDDITLMNLENLLLSAIETWENRIYIILLKASSDADNNQININLQFRLKTDLSDKIYNINESLITT